MSTGIQPEIIEGREPTSEELEQLAWAQEVHKKSLTTVHDSLRQMVTLATALLAGSAAFFVHLPAPVGFKALGAVFLMACLGFALRGALPQAASFDIHCIEEIREARERSLIVRSRLLLQSSICLFGGFGIIMAGIFVHLLWH